MPPTPAPTAARLRGIDFRSFDDALHEALGGLEDVRRGPWWLRCVEFHFTQGNCVAGDHFDWHLHNEIQCEVILTGEFSFGIRGGRSHTLKPGDVLILPPQIVHRWRCLRSGVMLGASYAIVPRADSLATPAPPANKALKLRPPALPLLLRGLVEEAALRGAGEHFLRRRLACWIYLISTQILSEGIFSSLAEDAATPESEAPRRHRIISKLVRFIDANLNADLSMESLARVARLSTRQVHRIFFEVTGSSCHRYVMQRRLELARSTLQTDPSLSVKEVAYQCGFSSASHFSTNFKRAFGVNPNDYPS